MNLCDQHHGLSSADTLANKLAKEVLPHSALMIASDLADQ
jgi:hypothetical protein